MFPTTGRIRARRASQVLIFAIFVVTSTNSKPDHCNMSVETITQAIPCVPGVYASYHWDRAKKWAKKLGLGLLCGRITTDIRVKLGLVWGPHVVCGN